MGSVIRASGSPRNKDGELLDRFERVTLWPMMGLAVISLITLVIDLTTDLSSSIQTSLDTMDWFIWAIFAIELLARLYLAPRRLRFLWKNPIDVAVVFVPTLQGFRALRIVRFARILRLARVGEMGVRAAREDRGILSAANSMYAVLITGFVISLTALMAWSVERDAVGSSIKTIPDAFWWAITTITTVGYGDKYPITPEGKAVAVILMFMGVALFGVVAATLASTFLRTKQSGQTENLLEHIDRLEAKIDKLTAAAEASNGGRAGVLPR